MRRLFTRILGAAASFAAAIAFAGCADNDSSLFISGIMVPEPPSCTVQPTGNALVLGNGVMDVAFTTEYWGWLLVGNQLAPRGQKNQLRTETARITLRGAEITILDSLGREYADPFTVPGTGFASVSASQEPGFGAFLARIIPAPIGASLRGEVGVFERRTFVANIRVFGDTLGGDEIESSELSFPIDVCNGCTIVYRPDPLPGGGACVADQGDAVPLPCFTGQAAIDCTTCAALPATRLLCTNPDAFLQDPNATPPPTTPDGGTP